MSYLHKNLITAAAGIVLAVGISSHAFANQVLTWNPSLTTPKLTTTSSNVTFDNINVADYATINLNNATGVVAETAYLNVSALQLAGQGVISSLNSLNGFGLYFAVTATAQLNAGLVGQFTSLSYTLYGYSVSNSLAAYSFANNTANPTVTTPAGSTVLALGTGSLINDSNNSVSITAGVPAATVDVTLTPNTSAATAGFFVNPAANIKLDLNAAFVNSQSVISSVISGGNTYFQINGGGGNATASLIPEPASLALLGVGLVGFGMFRRSRKQG